MIDYLIGTLESKTTNNITIDVNGIGYAVSISINTFSKLPEIGEQVKLYIIEAVSGMYGGVIYLYGFLSREDRNMYVLVKEEVPGTGAKKAMEYIDKISKSFIDFKTAILKKDTVMLQSIFGFTKKTSEKLISALKDKIQDICVVGEQKWSNVDASENSIILEAIDGLVALGYKESQARCVVNKLYVPEKGISVEELIRKSLQNL
ncbi:MAG: Holliday junction branch migration protein RuvA [Endomicrobium sp.]|jgi:Holliday junction DNA helicase RuvA|uniref:Holliday junction branch migration protein RuvA n=1 Tax=Candidatus Endomicrobiellum cubanum TaxID=3242325 RepID=UPI00282E586C|nr:Holliday junction branch migration protein RuvA [Endomicrobium sp.]